MGSAEEPWGSSTPFLLKQGNNSSSGGGSKRRNSSNVSASVNGSVNSGGGETEVRARFSLVWRRDVRVDYCLTFKVGARSGSLYGRVQGRGAWFDFSLVEMPEETGKSMLLLLPMGLDVNYN